MGYLLHTKVWALGANMCHCKIIGTLLNSILSQHRFPAATVGGWGLGDLDLNLCKGSLRLYLNFLAWSIFLCYAAKMGTVGWYNFVFFVLISLSWWPRKMRSQEKEFLWPEHWMAWQNCGGEIVEWKTMSASRTKCMMIKRIF